MTATTTYRLDLPYERPPLTANQRMHWRPKAEITKNVRHTAATLARNAKIPALGRCAVRLVWTVTDRRRRDADNLVPTLKACADGLVDADVVADDVPALMTKHMPEIVLGDTPGLVLIVEPFWHPGGFHERGQAPPRKPDSAIFGFLALDLERG